MLDTSVRPAMPRSKDGAEKSPVDIGFRSIRYGLEGAFAGVAFAGIIAMLTSSGDHTRFDHLGALVGFFVVMIGRYFSRSEQ